MASQLSQKRALDPPSIPNRLYFKIGDVARICDLETYVLRFWESQFPQLKPNKSGTGQRLYRRRDVELVLDIKRLVHAEGYTIAGARQALDQSQRRAPRRDSQASQPSPAISAQPQSNLPLSTAGSSRRLDSIAATIGHARAELREIAALLAAPDPRPQRRRPRLAAVHNPSDTLFPT
jgi:DNA-binding transcriptional MerR regulator